jgi:hypothetical protein
MTSVSANTPRRVLKIFKHFGKYCSCHIQILLLGLAVNRGISRYLSKTLILKMASAKQWDVMVSLMMEYS